VVENRCQHLTPGDGLPCRYYIRPIVKEEPGFCQRPDTFRCVEAMKHKLPAISYSSLTDFIACRRRYYHRTVEGLQVKPQHLPESAKLSKGWDLFSRAMHEPGFDYLPGIQELQFTPEQNAKLSALMRAYEDLEIDHNPDEARCQYEVRIPVGQTNIKGYIHRLYPKYFVETKFTTRPDFYQEKENLTFQLGTYFMTDDSLEYAVVEITRAPALKTGYGRLSDEDMAHYESRLHSDVCSRPSFYFSGYNKESRTFGVKFWRSEFDLEEIRHTYEAVLQEIRVCAQRGHWWENHLACHIPAPCPYLSIKKSGVISEEIYERRAVPDWCRDVCSLTEAVSRMCEVKNPCPKWGKEVKQSEGTK